MSFLWAMKNVIWLIAAFFVSLSGICQTDPVQAPYKRFPSVPPLKLLLADSTSFFTKDDLQKKRPVMVMLFSPDCEHCQHEMEQIIKNIYAFEKTQVILSTTRDFDNMVEFIKRYQLDRFENIIVGKDVGYMLPVFYNIRNLPFLAFYNRQKELISVFEGTMPVEKMIAELKK